MYKHSNIGSGIHWKTGTDWSTLTIAADSAELPLIKPVMSTAGQTAQDYVDEAIHWDPPAPHSQSNSETFVVLTRMTTPVNIVGGQDFMIEFSGRVIAQLTAATGCVISPIVVMEETAWTITTNLATAAVANNCRLLPVQTHHSDGDTSVSASWNNKIVVQNDDVDEPICVGFAITNYSGGNVTCTELLANYSARYAIERIPTYEREY